MNNNMLNAARDLASMQPQLLSNIIIPSILPSIHR